MAIPYDLANHAVIALEPESSSDEQPSAPPEGTRVLAPIYNPRGYVRHWPATVISADAHSEDRVLVAYDQGHQVGHYGRIENGSVFTVDLVILA